MKINVNAFIAVILCAALLSGLWVLSNSRDELETNIWSPHAIYEHVGGSSYVSPELPTYSSRSSSDDVVVKMSPSRTMSRRVSSVPYGLIPSSSYGLITSSPNGLAASSPHGLITYASSNATYHSFGGGGDMSGGMSGGSFRANPEAMPAAAALSVPSMPNYAMASRSAYVAPQQQADLAAVSAISEAASAYDMPMRSSITSIGDQLYRIGASDLTFGYGQRSFGINSQKRVSIADNYIGWLSTPEMWEEALGEDLSGGAEGLTKDQIMALYLAATGDTDFSNQQQWDAFWAWLNMQQENDSFKWKLLPLGDAIPFILLLCLLYVGVVRYRARKQESI